MLRAPSPRVYWRQLLPTKGWTLRSGVARVRATGAHKLLVSIGASALISASCGCRMGGVWATPRRNIPWNVRAGHAGHSLVSWTFLMLAYRIAADRARRCALSVVPVPVTC